MKSTPFALRGSFTATSKRFAGGGYKFFEDMYPKHEPGPRFASYEDQMKSFEVKSLEPKKQFTESEKLHHLYDWKKTKGGLELPQEFGWNEEWGPEPGEDGHNTYYEKNRMFMSYEEKSKYDLRIGVPLEKNAMRQQELPYQKRLKGAYRNLEERDGGQYVSMRKRNYWAKYSYEDQRDTIAKAKDDFFKEWLDKPDVTPQNVSKKISDYNGTNKNQNIKSVQRRPEWELAPVVEDNE
ncbi:unnamed protein product [Phytomonas sp. Hart1]|nr:unnamed protein product [Phytomonas sp. Hart1]|eukprot:CCW65952.1 unnamed protein product [Phytomonas sp. isolate Hart1]